MTEAQSKARTCQGPQPGVNDWKINQKIVEFGSTLDLAVLCFKRIRNQLKRCYVKVRLRQEQRLMDLYADF